MQSLAPIVLFVYNRPSHTRQTLDALSKNHLADGSILYIYADGAKEEASEDTLKAIRKTREIIRQKKWCREVVIIESEKNKGLADSIIKGVTSVVNKHGKVIVLEDDIVTSPGFLQYMNDALNTYKNVDKVMHISSYLPMTSGGDKLPETFFLRYMNCWGWATWKSAWSMFNPDIQYLHNELVRRKDFNEFDLGGYINSFEQVTKNLDGSMYTWAIKWHISIFLKEGLCLFPRKSLIDNIGVEDGTGENCTCDDDRWRVYSPADSIHVMPPDEKKIKESKVGRNYLIRFAKYGNNSSFKIRLSHKQTIIRKMNSWEIIVIIIQKISKVLKRKS